ncbi:unnamed protein product [Hymenolepis diminuta]|uniref:Ubiquitin-like domain-containing protein n=1 Tax=Hymenolepis diminuta TaxID=6216 RepID=A0A0R3SFH4_HYMDI|nr:unnamed protein product [Hymenolepis diminuta]
MTSEIGRSYSILIHTAIYHCHQIANVFNAILEKLDRYICEELVDNTRGDGSKEQPYRTLYRLVEAKTLEKVPELRTYVDAGSEKSGKRAEISKTHLKKAMKSYKIQCQESTTAVTAAITQTTMIITVATHALIASVETMVDLSLPESTKSKIRQEIMDIVLRDKTGLHQCILANDKAQAADALTLTPEYMIFVKAIVSLSPEGQTTPGGFELHYEFGTCPHGSSGLDFERFRTWLLGQYHIRGVYLYPVFTGHDSPQVNIICILYLQHSDFKKTGIFY